MPRVERLFKSQHVNGRWYAKIEGGDTLAVDLGLIGEYSLFTGRELDGAELAALTAAAAKMNVKARALRMLGARAMSRRELEDRLRERGESQEDIREALDYLEALGYVDDAGYAASVVRHYSGRGYGPARVRQELYRRGVPRELWEGALSEMPEDTGAIDAVIDRRLRGVKPDKKELKRLTDMLLRRGFDWGEIKQALARYDFVEGNEDE